MILIIIFGIIGLIAAILLVRGGNPSGDNNLISENIAKYSIGNIILTLETNGFPKGFVLKREPTIKESMYILQNILGFANEDYKEWFDDKEERQDYLNQCQFILTEFLKGECDWNCLCNETQCYDYDEIGFPFTSAFSLAYYLKIKEII